MECPVNDYIDSYPPPTFDTTKPHSARAWDYWLGGKDNFAVDREFADRYAEIFPEIIEIARADRAFLGRAISYLAGEAGIRQFLDIGTGLPTVDNTHEVAQRIAPDSRIVYVDNDPLVLVHARALLSSSPEGATAYIDADMRSPQKILNIADQTLDFTQPIALSLLGIMGTIADLDEAHAIVKEFMNALPSGSYLAVNDGTDVLMGEARRQELLQLTRERPGYGYYHRRTPEQIARFFTGLELLEPGVVSTPLWRPAPGSIPTALDAFCGVARKP
ncbi:SAM-dependent methyltransferase [Frankia sp. Cj3]|uniref:SAM-dependent methyltransferase n=1 Tax=Frankia sp. Cj3 TaxID=2880976 RepID=UPI00351D8033